MLVPASETVVGRLVYTTGPSQRDDDWKILFVVSAEPRNNGWSLTSLTPYGDLHGGSLFSEEALRSLLSGNRVGFWQLVPLPRASE